MSKELFDHINHIQYKQNPKYFELLSKEDKKSWSTFMILKFFSMDIQLTNTINYLNRFQSTLTDEQMYQFMINLLPKNNYNLNYLKNKKKEKTNDAIECLQEAYRCNERKAYEYYKILNEDEINYILQSFGKKE